MLANSQTPSREYRGQQAPAPHVANERADGATDVSKQARALTGTVTKLLDNFGFIDDSVFFQLSVVKGGDVHVGDKVYCECSYSEHLPFKWNATKVHLVQAGRPASGSAPAQSASPQVATTYLQHRLQQQQQSRDEPTAGLVAPHNYYSSQQAVSNPAFSQLDLSKAQQAVAAAQQLTGYYGRETSFSQLQYTSTPGAAFVSSALPFTQQIQQNLLSTQPRASTATFKSSASRWERDDRRADDRFRGGERARKRNDSRDRSVSKDEFGRDIRGSDKSKERERERIERERERRNKRSISPSSSVGSQNAVVRAARRRYEPVNIPKLTILKSPLNVYDLKQRYSANLHVPSDLKEVVINSSFVLNINDIPKPITFRVIETKDANKKKESSKKADSPKDKESEKKESKESKESKAKDEKPEVIELEDSNGKSETKQKSSVEPPVSSRQTFKYGVKVLLISIPSMSDIFERIFGPDFDAIGNGTKSYFLHFNKLLSFLVSRNSNDGFSLIGGKFSAHLDGYLPDSEEPNLIATAIRVVGEQTGMNLSKCGKWRLVATFVFNRDNSVDPMNPSLELTRVLMPDVWSAFDTIYEPLKNSKTINELENDNNFVLSNDKSENNSEVVVNSKETNEAKEDARESLGAQDNADAMAATHPLPESSSSAALEASSDSAMDLSQTISSPAVDSTEPSVPIVESAPDSETVADDQLAVSERATGDSSLVDRTADDSTAPADSVLHIDNEQSAGETEISATPAKTGPSGDASELQLLLSRINDMKVAELRAELEKRGSRLKGNLKKADLVTKLRQLINQLLEDEDIVSDEVKNDWWAQRILSKEGTNEDSVEDADNKSADEEMIDEEALLKEEEEDSVQTNDVAMTEPAKEAEPSHVEVVSHEEAHNEEQMAVDLTGETKVVKEVEENKEVKNEPENQNGESDKTKATQNGTVKRKGDSEQSPPKEIKKSKNGEAVEQVIPTKVTDGCVYVKGGENLTVITLHEALNHQRYDQFEMSIISEVIRESLIHHFSHYILSALVYNHKHPLSKEDKSALESKTPLAVNYAHLSFSYFDSSHCGHLLAEDLTKLLSNANFTLSRRSFGVLVNNEDKVTYRELQEPKELLPLKSNKLTSNARQDSAKSLSSRIYERDGTVYDIEQLIDQSESDQRIKVRLNEELIADRDKICQLNEYIQELESRQKKMTTATEKQNDEICCLKREREILKKEYDILKKAMETTYAEFGKILVKNDKKEIEGQKSDK